MAKTTLKAICEKFCNVQHNEKNYSVGGGLSIGKFASNRHEDAKHDEGKLTLGAATQLFKKATGLTTEEVKEIIEYAVPYMEWHHAGKLPKQYGGAMKKTYFLNSKEICKVATEWNEIIEKLNLHKANEAKKREQAANLAARKAAFLDVHGTKVTRVATKPAFFFCQYSECNGKYGWFDAAKNIYKMPEYHTGYSFENETIYKEFLKIN